jgi:hypothetical protein
LHGEIWQLQREMVNNLPFYDWYEQGLEKKKILSGFFVELIYQKRKITGSSEKAITKPWIMKKKLFFLWKTK